MERAKNNKVNKTTISIFLLKKLYYIAALKDGFGFIETISHDREIFFHFSNVESKADRLEVGLEVEYTVFNREKGGKVSAENVKIMRRGTILPIPGKEDILHGKVVRPLRSVNPDQTDYCGLIQVKNEDGTGEKLSKIIK